MAAALRHRTKAAPLLSALLVSTLLGACGPVVTDVPLQVEGRKGDGQAAHMTITEGANGIAATAAVEGQYFTGRVVQESHRESYPVREWVTYKDRDGHKRQRLVEHIETRTIYEPIAFGLLTSGSSGDVMRCTFRLAAPQWGFSQGGIADCELSDGTAVVASF